MLHLLFIIAAVNAAPPPLALCNGTCIASVSGCAINGVAASGCRGGALITISGNGFSTILTRNSVTFRQYTGLEGAVKCEIQPTTTVTQIVCKLSNVTATSTGIYEVIVRVDSALVSSPTVTIQFDFVPNTGTVFPQLFSMQGCRVNGVASSGCTTGSTVTLIGSNFDITSNQITFSGGTGITPICSPVTYVSQNVLECKLSYTESTKGTWRLTVVSNSIVSPGTSLVTMQIESYLSIGLPTPPSPPSTPTPPPVDYSKFANPPPSNGGISLQKSRTELILVVIGCFLLFVVLLGGIFAFHKYIISPFMVRLARNKRQGPTRPPDMSFADRELQKEVDVMAPTVLTTANSPSNLTSARDFFVEPERFVVPATHEQWMKIANGGDTRMHPRSSMYRTDDTYNPLKT